MIPKNEMRGWQELQAKMKSLPEKVRQKNISNLLVREARPLVWAARSAAYEGGPRGRVGKKSVRGSSTLFYNLYKTIDVFKNKKSQDFRYVVVGLRGTRKKPAGAFYGTWQLFGGTKKNFQAKGFIEKAENQYGNQVSDKAARAVNKEIEKILGQTFTRA